MNYQFTGTESVITPALIYYYDTIKDNVLKAIEMAGGAEYLWPHIKTHKCAQIVRMQIELGITRFKCATIAEAEMAASYGASHVLVAYPLIGPDIDRFLQLKLGFPTVEFWAIGDCRKQLEILNEKAGLFGTGCNVLIDVNTGMDRTGVEVSDLPNLYQYCAALDNLILRGFHCYDGQRTEKELKARTAGVKEYLDKLVHIKEELQQKKYCCDTLVVGGSPSFPCYRKLGIQDAYYSPGTVLLNDYGYFKKYPDMNFTPGAAILTRVVSNPAKGYFTLDLGYKGIAADPPGARGRILGLEHAEEMFQSEEHWTWRMEEGYEEETPEPGEEFYVIPTHICPTSALYSSAVAVKNERVIGEWMITARNRKITY